MIRFVISFFILTAAFLFTSFNKQAKQDDLPNRFLVILGTAQDAGYPQAGCDKACCRPYWDGTEPAHAVVSFAIVDQQARQYWLFEATPDMAAQMHRVQRFSGKADKTPDAVFITHAHTGHYTGLMQFGREAMNTSKVPVYALPRMDSFLRNNGPWSQLVKLENISLRKLDTINNIELAKDLAVKTFTVPHRDEFSETAGFMIRCSGKKILFIPDIDKWEKWNHDIIPLIQESDFALLDATFYRNGELPGRNMSEIPHPFVEESMKRFAGLSASDKAKIYFIHFNHTNPLVLKKSAAKDSVRAAGFGVAEEGQVIRL